MTRVGTHDSPGPIALLKTQSGPLLEAQEPQTTADHLVPGRDAPKAEGALTASSAMALPQIRKVNTPKSVDAPLVGNALADAHINLPGSAQLAHAKPMSMAVRLSKLRTMQLVFDDGPSFVASSYLYAGSFGAVSLALDDKLQPWAVKVMRTAAKPNAKTQVTNEDGFLSELAYTKQYLDPHAFAAKDSEGELYLFLPALLMSAHDAVGHLQGTAAHQPFLRSVATQMAEALTRVHRDGNVILDLKPGNIMITRQGAARLSDFGETVSLAGFRALQAGETASIPGTPIFRAPEMMPAFVTQTPLDQPAALDMWSLGMTLASMAVDVRSGPFRGCGNCGGHMVFRPYSAWRAGFMKNGTFDMAALLREPTDGDPDSFSDYFQRVAQVDAPLCRAVLEHLLCKVDERSAAPTFLKAIEHLSFNATAIPRIAAGLERLSKEQHAVFNALQRRHHLLAPTDNPGPQTNTTQESAPTDNPGPQTNTTQESAPKVRESNPWLLRLLRINGTSILTK